MVTYVVKRLMDRNTKSPLGCFRKAMGRVWRECNMSLDIVSYLLGTKSAGGDSSQLELVQVTEEVTKGDILPVADIFSHSVIIALADHLYGGHSPIVAAFRSRTTTTLAFGESIAGSSGAYIEVTIDKTSKAITSIIAKVDGTSFATINTAIRFYLYNLK